MLIRYKKQDGGGLQKTAVIYVKKEHKIDRSRIDPDALKIIARLHKHNHSAYIVGGAVRDVMIGKSPKDFDVVTDAEPNQIKRLFRNSRIIGKRFRLVHIFFGHDKIVEVATFRSLEAGTFNNVYGSIEEDALRRDFSINGLYYDPQAEQVIDFVHGVKDLKARRLKPIIPRDRIFSEDPVRMIRAIKYSSTTGCRIGFFLSRQIKKSSALMEGISPSRISEEIFKILDGGHSVSIIRALRAYGLFKYLMPRLDGMMDQASFEERLYRSLATLDQAVRQHRESRRSVQLSYLVGDYLLGASRWTEVKRLPFPEVYADIKDLLKPVTPPNVEVEKALVYLIRKRKLYQKDGILPLSEPESSKPLPSMMAAAAWDAEPGMGAASALLLDAARDASFEADVGDFFERPTRRRRRPGQSHAPHPNPPAEKAEAKPAGEGGSSGKPRRRPRRRKSGGGAGTPAE